LKPDQDLIERTHDFRKAYLDAKEDSIIAEAVRLLIADQIKNNRDLHRRYKAARVNGRVSRCVAASLASQRSEKGISEARSKWPHLTSH
jgi:hypothetical protein